ncbi:MAG: hypothetical protein IJ191_09755 [Treponema sp.]|nr:hypothetical protein [Treponema sp.]
MNHTNNYAFGRKVFFLCPTFAMKSALITRLIDNEYETYIIDDYRAAKTVLREYPRSICFVNIDDVLPHEHWFHFVASCEADSSLASILFGVISAHIHKEEHSRFTDTLDLRAGFITMTESMDEVTEKIINTLAVNSAKGRRQYVRSSCADDKSALLLIRNGTKAYKMDLLDISVVGTACLARLSEKDYFAPNTVFRNITITLGTKNITLDAVVYATIPAERFCKLVLLFIQPVAPETKQIIRGYIAAKLQSTVAAVIRAHEPDSTDYSHAVEAPHEKSHQTGVG